MLLPLELASSFHLYLTKLAMICTCTYIYITFLIAFCYWSRTCTRRGAYLGNDEHLGDFGDNFTASLSANLMMKWSEMARRQTPGGVSAPACYCRHWTGSEEDWVQDSQWNLASYLNDSIITAMFSLDWFGRAIGGGVFASTINSSDVDRRDVDNEARRVPISGVALVNCFQMSSDETTVTKKKAKKQR